jgi:hypothetical protein
MDDIALGTVLIECAKFGRRQIGLKSGNRMLLMIIQHDVSIARPISGIPTLGHELKDSGRIGNRFFPVSADGASGVIRRCELSFLLKLYPKSERAVMHASFIRNSVRTAALAAKAGSPLVSAFYLRVATGLPFLFLRTAHTNAHAFVTTQAP